MDYLDYIGTIVCILVALIGGTLAISTLVRPKWKGWIRILWILTGTAGFLTVTGIFLKACDGTTVVLWG